MWQILVKGLDGKTKCVQITSPAVSGGDLKERLFHITRIPPQFQRLVYGTRDLADDSLVFRKPEEDPHPPCISLVLRLRGGKGGFGSLLRGAATKAGQKKTTNFDSCRDMSGRRLRHANAEKLLEEWKAEAHERQLEKIAEAYIKKQSKLKNRRPSDGAANDLNAYAAQASKARQDVESAVRDGLMESLNLKINAKRKYLQQKPQAISKRPKLWMVGDQAISKRPKLWMVGEENEDDEEEEDIAEDPDLLSMMMKKNDGSGSSSSSAKDEMPPSDRSKGKSRPEASSDDDESFCQAVPLSRQSDSSCVSQKESSVELENENGGSLGFIKEQSVKVPGLVEPHHCPGVVAGTCQCLPSEISGSEAETCQGSPSEMIGSEAGTCQGLVSEIVSSEATSKPASEIGMSLGEGVSDSLFERSDIMEEPINFDDFQSAEEMEVLGLERLKNELQSRGLKCGGSLFERAARLFLLRTTPLEKLHKKHLAKLKDAALGFLLNSNISCLGFATLLTMAWYFKNQKKIPIYLALAWC